jgi:hypothetical protein
MLGLNTILQFAMAVSQVTFTVELNHVGLAQQGIIALTKPQRSFALKTRMHLLVPLNARHARYIQPVQQDQQRICPAHVMYNIQNRCIKKGRVMAVTDATNHA